MTGRAGYLAAIAAGRDRLVESARGAGPDTPVPSCRRWTVRDLVVHAGNVHDWASSVLRSGVEQPQVFDAEPTGIGDGFDELLFWYAGRADALLDLLLGDEVPDDAPVWTFGPQSSASTAGFWPRRQAHEVTIHSADAMLAAGRPVLDALIGLDPTMSADGVDEVLTVMLPRVAMFVPRPSMPGGLLIAATDTGAVGCSSSTARSTLPQRVPTWRRPWSVRLTGCSRCSGAGPSSTSTASSSG